MKLQKLCLIIVATGLLSSEVFANEYDKGYKEGLQALSKDKYFTEAHTQYKKNMKTANTDRDKYLERSKLGASAKGSCGRLTYLDTDDKSYEYLSGFEKGCYEGVKYVK